MDKIITEFGIDWKLFTAEVVNFLLVMVVLVFVYKKVQHILTARQETIAKGISDAEKAEVKLSSAEEEKKEILTTAQAEASENIKASVAKAKEREETILAEAAEKAERALAEAKAKGEAEKERIIASSNEELAKLAVLGAEKVLAAK